MRVLLTAIGSYGDLNPYIGLGLALQARGHTPVLAVTRAYCAAGEAAGLECRAVRPDGDPNDPKVTGRIMHPLLGPEYLVRRLLMPCLREMYDDLFEAASDADAIVSHPLTFAAPLVAEKRQLPWAGAVLAPMSFFSNADPPLVLPSALVAAAHRRWPIRVGSALVTAGKFGTKTWGHPVQVFRREIGLPPGGHPLYKGQFSPHLNLGLFSAVLARPQPDWPPRTVITGAVWYDAVQGSMPIELVRFLDQGPAPVVCTLGSAAVTVRNAPRFYKEGAAAARAMGLRAVLLVGPSPGIARPRRRRMSSSPSGRLTQSSFHERPPSSTRAAQARFTRRCPRAAR